MSAHIQALLGCGVDVVLDFPANTAVQRHGFKALAEAAGAQHLLVYLEADDELCLERLALRRVQCPERAPSTMKPSFGRLVPILRRQRPRKRYR